MKQAFVNHQMVFGNRSILVHLAKGVAGFVALGFALDGMNRSIWPSILLLPIAMFFFQGCPICWTIGLFETVIMRIQLHIAEQC